MLWRDLGWPTLPGHSVTAREVELCEAPADGPRTGWQGWLDVPIGSVSRPAGQWIDLTHSFSANVPRAPLFPAPSVDFFAKMPEADFNISHLETVVHVGTHVDAPRHFYSDGPGMDQVPLERLTGEGVAVRINKPLFGAIEAEDLEAVSPEIRQGDIVAICMGWSKHWGKAEWSRHPHLSIDAAKWLIDRQIKLVAIDTMTPDMADEKREDDHDFPIHCELLKYGVLIAEQVANLEAVAGSRMEFMFCPMRIVDCDGAPARVLARKIS